MNTTDEFIKAMMLIPLTIEEPIEYRLHYDKTGGIYLCTQQNHPTDTTYLVVDEKTYSEYYKYQIVVGKLKIIDYSPSYSVQLKSSSQGYRVVQDHAGIVLTDDEEYRDIEYYDDN
jgi:hypothetical protein